MNIEQHGGCKTSKEHSKTPLYGTMSNTYCMQVMLRDNGEWETPAQFPSHETTNKARTQGCPRSGVDNVDNFSRLMKN